MTVVRGVAVAFAAGLLLCGCAARDPYVTNEGATTSGNWQIARQTDRVTGRTLPSATIVAYASNTFVNNPKPASLQLSCFEGRPVVRLAFSFKTGPDRNSALGYRFDDRPGRDNVESRSLGGQQIVLIEQPAAVSQFVEDMKGASKLYVRLRSLSAARTSAEFTLAGSDEAMRAGFADCPVQAPAQSPVQAAPAQQPPPRRSS